MVRYQSCWFTENFRIRKKMKKIPDFEILRECGIIYDSLCKQCVKISNVFAVQILILIPMLLMLIIFDTFQTCRMIQHLTEFDSGCIIFDILYLGAILELVLPCIAVENEANRFVDNLHKINNNQNQDIVRYSNREKISIYFFLSAPLVNISILSPNSPIFRWRHFYSKWKIDLFGE